MPKYLAIAAMWVEADNADEAGDLVNDRLGDFGPLAKLQRAEGTVGKVTVYTEAQTHQEGFLRDAAAQGVSMSPCRSDSEESA